MKKLILILVLAGVTHLGAQAQGTIAFGNGPLTRVQVADLLGGTSPVTFPFNVAVYFAETPGDWQAPVSPLGRSTSDSGIFTGSVVHQIPGTEAGQVVYMQLYAWEARFGDDPYQAWLGGAQTTSTGVRQVQLGETAGPGTVIWQSPTGTNPNRFTPLFFGLANPAPPVVPEPSTFALGALGGLALLLRWCKSARK